MRCSCAASGSGSCSGGLLTSHPSLDPDQAHVALPDLQPQSIETPNSIPTGPQPRWQQEEEVERGRLVSAQSLMGRALRTVEPKHLAMIAKLRAPPRILCAVLEMVLILLHEPMADLADASSPTLEKAAATWPRAQPLLEQAGP